MSKKWRVEHGNSGWEVWEQQDTGSIRIATTGHAQSFDRENARLFAAAPDLLKACEIIIAAHDMDLCGEENWNALFDEARNAIHKAKGE
jgi:hypothetical protein